MDRIHQLARQQRANPGLLFGDQNMNSVDEESVNLSNSEDNDEFIPEQEDHDEVEDDDMGINYDDDEDGDKSMWNASIDLNDDNNVGQPTGPPQEGMVDENPGVEDNEINRDEPHDQNLTEFDEGYDENPGVVDHENEGVGEEDHDVHIDEANYKDQDNVSTEVDAVKDITADQDSGEEDRVQGTPQYNLRKNRARSYKHVYDPELYETENVKQTEMGDVVLTTVDNALKDMPQMSMKKGLKLFGEGGYAAVKKEMQQLHD